MRTPLFLRRPRALLALSLACALVAAPLGAQPPAAPPGLNAYVEQVRGTFAVPGIALAIVKDGQVVLTQGYGVREKDKPTPVDEHTLFGIASNSKAVTATALGMLVEEGKLAWDARVVDYLPWFQLADPYVTRELTVRDLLVHRSGLALGAGDLLWWPPTTYSREEVVRRLRHLPLATSFRGTYAYDNVLYIAAGQLVEAVSGQTWEEFVAARILRPVGMTESHVRHPGAAAPNLATPHASVEGVVRPVAPFASDNANPAAGIHSNARDVARWMIVQLDSGRVGDTAHLFAPATARQLWTLVTPQPIGTPAPELAALRPSFRGYALGFEVRDYRGQKLVTHTGGLPGYVSRVMLVPDLKLGVAVLTNQEAGAAFDALAYRVLDHYLGAPATDWAAAYRRTRLRTDSSVAAAERETAAARRRGTRPSLPLAAYAATYTDPWYGEVPVALENGRLVLRFAATPALVGDLEHWQHDTFVVRWRDRELRADAFLSFALNADGRVEQATMRAVSPATDFSFDFHDLRLRPAPRPPTR